MKQQVNPAMIIVAVIVGLLLLVFIGWRSFGSNSATMDQATINAHIAAKKKLEGLK